MAGRRRATGMRAGTLRGQPPSTRTPRQVDVLEAFVEVGGSIPDAAARLGLRPSTAKRHLADLRARSGLTSEQLIYTGRAAGWLVVPSLEAEALDAQASGTVNSLEEPLSGRASPSRCSSRRPPRCV